MGQKQSRTTGATSGDLQVAMHSQLPLFLVLVCSQLTSYINLLRLINMFGLQSAG